MKPRVFIASSAESLAYAEAIQENLSHDFEVTIWNQVDKILSAHFIVTLSNQLSQSDYGIFVCTPDDLVVIRGKEIPAVRANVLFELGLFMGRIGRDSCFWILPKTGMEMPSDLHGLMPAAYDPDHRGTLQAKLGTACTQIKNNIRRIEKTKFNGNIIPEMNGEWLSYFIEDDGDGPYLTIDRVMVIQHGRKIAASSECTTYDRGDTSYLTGEMRGDSLLGTFLVAENIYTGAGSFQVRMSKDHNWMDGYCTWINYPDKNIASSKYIWHRSALSDLENHAEEIMNTELMKLKGN